MYQHLLLEPSIHKQRELSCVPNTNKIYANHDISAHSPSYHKHKYAGILILARYLLRTFFDAPSANSPYNVAKHSIWYTCRLVVSYSCVLQHSPLVRFGLRKLPTSLISIIMYYFQRPDFGTTTTSVTIIIKISTPMSTYRFCACPTKNITVNDLKVKIDIKIKMLILFCWFF